jgi:uncharacterized protein involved in exopolysaccharide biosynthesis
MPHFEPDPWDEDIHLRENIRRVIQFWPFICLLTAVFLLLSVGWILLQPPTYEAVARIYLPEYTKVDTDTVGFLMSDAIITGVGEKVTLPDDFLDTVSVAAVKSDSSLFRVRVFSADPAEAAILANTWAQECIDWINQRYLSQGKQWMKESLNNLNGQEEELLAFLKSESLNRYTISELRLYEGFPLAGESLVVPSTEPPALSTGTRTALRQLLRDQANAEAVYADAQASYYQRRKNIRINGAMIINQAEVPEDPYGSDLGQVAANAGLASLAGFWIAVLLVELHIWWQRPVKEHPVEKTK